ncbi:MAG: iron complex transport system ATP-binding protein [Cellvibrionaceae bacterium]
MPNKVNGIIGPNGHGKTTLLRCLYNRLTPSAGKVCFNQVPFKEYDRKALAQHIAVVAQEYPSEFHLTVEDILHLGFLPYSSLTHKVADSRQKQVAHIAVQLELEHLLHRYFDTLSGGEKQRTMIARALLQQPQVLILDEPTNHLDIHHQMSLLRFLQRADITVICSLHDVNMAARFCDSISVLQYGKIVAQGSPEKVMTESLLSSVFSIDVAVTKNTINQRVCIELL